MHTHRLVRRLILSAALGAMLLAGGVGSAFAQTKVKLGTVAWIGYAPFYVAVERNLFAKHGVKVELQDFPDPSLMPSAIAGGGLQGAMYTYDQVITSVGMGQKHRVVMPIDYSNGADAIIADKSIKSIADLKGKKVAYPFSTCDNLLVVFALEQAGLKESDIVGIDTTPETVAAALTAGAAAGATYEPNITQILKLGGGSKYKVLYTSKSAPGLITDVLYFDEAFIAKNRKAVEGVIAGYIDGLAYLKAKPEEARRIVAKYMSATPAEVKAQQAGVYNIPPSEMASYFEKRDDSKSLFKVGAGIGEILKKRAQIPATPTIEDTFDASFVTAVGKAK